MLIQEALGALALQNTQETPAIDPTSPSSSSLDDEPQPSLPEVQLQ